MALFSRLGNYRNFGLLELRAGLGIMMFIHGLDKLTGGPSTWINLGESMKYVHIHFLPVFWGFMCAITESIGGLFCILGLWFRLVSILMVINFIVAILFLFAKGNSIKESTEAIELCCVFFGLIFVGPGNWSIDRT